jgi:proline dehydrogenase
VPRKLIKDVERYGASMTTKINPLERPLSQATPSILRRMQRVYWLSGAARVVCAHLARPKLEGALHLCRLMDERGLASTICYWDSTRDTPRKTADAYLKALEGLGRKSNCFLSMRAPALGLDSDLVAEVLERARQDDIGIHFDALGPETADRTFSLIMNALPGSSKLGCTIPGRWRRSPHDAALAVDFGLNVRVVKGQWVDPEEPGMDPRAGFLAIIDRLAGRARHVAVATHDLPLAQEALQRLRAANTSCELQLIFGLPTRHLVRQARAAGVPVRFYVPYGHAYLPQVLSKVRQNPRILWTMARALLTGSSRSLLRTR